MGRNRPVYSEQLWAALAVCFCLVAGVQLQLQGMVSNCCGVPLYQ